MPDGRLDVTASYDDLLRRGDAPPGSTWGLFDPTSERGMADLAGPEQVLAASSLVRTGEVVNLDHSLAAFDPPMARARQAPRHTIVAGHPQSRDDSLDFFLQASSQVDGLRHRRAQDWGFYDGHADAQIAVGSPTLGVQRWAERPVVGRGVLLDVAAARAGLGAPLDHARGEVLEVATGFAQRRALPRWLWDHRVALFATDTFAVERLPVVPDSEFAASAVDDAGMMHQELIASLGMPLGELWRLDALAAACAQDQRWQCLVVVKPLHLEGGVGSPANATALR